MTTEIEAEPVPEPVPEPSALAEAMQGVSLAGTTPAADVRRGLALLKLAREVEAAGAAWDEARRALKAAKDAETAASDAFNEASARLYSATVEAVGR